MRDHLPEDPKVLIAFYSYSGNTRALAWLLQQQTAGDLVEIIPETPYPPTYQEVVDQARTELSADYRPKLATNLVDVGPYELVLVGSPNWWHTLAPPLHSFLASYNFTGKTIAPFITHEGTGLGRSAADIARLCPWANLREGLAVRGRQAAAAQQAVAAWVSRIGLRA